MRLHFSLFFLAAGFSSMAQTNQVSAPPRATISMVSWQNGSPPFQFKYGGKDSAAFLSNWQSTKEIADRRDGKIHRYTYVDPATHLKVIAEVRTFDHFDAYDWVLYFTNEGTADTPIIENIQPLHWSLACNSPDAMVHAVQGSDAAIQDFTPREENLGPGGSVILGTVTGRSSDNANLPGNYGGAFPFFNLQTGDHGVVGAIGWTGSWLAHFNRDQAGKTIAMDAGMLKTHLLLHPGETIRTPRILLMNWKGDLAEAQNTWRQLMINEYSPKDADGKPPVMPISWGTWGTERVAKKLALIKGIIEQKLPIDVYWIDAGWYEPMGLPAGHDGDAGSDWYNHRGDWIISRNLYPDTMRPMGEALKAAGIGFLVWFESETTNPEAKNFHLHPDWYLLQPGKQMTGGAEAFLNLGKPEALKWINDLLSSFFTQNEVTWYRQDFNFVPAPYWDAADTPDRVGMSEIKSIMGLYTLWDNLRTQHPGLRIDNCASGGRRLDIETMSRSVSLWRSDNAGDPVGEQYHTVGLMPWNPMTSGVWVSIKGQAAVGSALQLYQQRSAYCAGLTFNGDQDPAPWLKQALEEFDEVRPYYLGDFYSLLPQETDPTTWAAWQLQKRDRRSGLLMVLRRPDSPYPTLQLEVKGLDPAAQYDVEMRTTIHKVTPRQMTGKDLARLQVTLADKPGSMLVFYRKR